jgi:DNA-binding XRE family transcriptional regulator
MARTKNPDEFKVRGTNFSKRVAERRRTMGLTQKQLAQKANVSPELIQAIERGRSSNPSFFIAVDILRSLDVEVGCVVEWAGGVKNDQ